MTASRAAAVAALRAAVNAGVQLIVLDGELLIRPPEGTDHDLLAALGEQRAEVANLLEALAERAAICEFDGGLPRAEAEAEAWRRVVQ